MYITLRTLYIELRTLYIVHTLRNLLKLISSNGQNNLHCTLYNVQCTLYNIQFTLYSLHCTVLCLEVNSPD